MKTSSIAISLAILVTTSAFADDLQLGEGYYSGSGCPQGALTIQRNNKKIDFKFTSISAEAGDQSSKFVDRKECDITIPVHVPRGLSFAVAPVEYKGSVNLPYGTQSKLYINYYYEYVYGISQQNLWSSWAGQQDGTFSLFAPKKQNYTPFWSACSTDAKLRLNFTMIAQTNDTNQSANMSIDQLNGFELLTQKCQ